MRSVIKQCWRGCGWLPHVGDHPGTGMCIGLTLLTGLAGAQTGGALGFVVAAAAGALVYVPMYMYGAYSRARLSDGLEARATPSPQPNLMGLEQIGRITEGGSIEWFKPPIRKGTALYAAPGSTLKPEEIECVCKRDVCTYDHDFGCGLDRSKERQDV